MEYIWRLYYFDWDGPVRLWYFTTEENAQNAMKKLLPGRNECHFSISKVHLDQPDIKF